MPRLPRIHIEEGLYFITARGDHGGELFKDDADGSQYLELLAKYKEQFQFKLYAYVLMPTYVHLLIELPKETTISQIMHAINSTYTKYFNGRYERKGHLFQERFKAVVVEKASYLRELTVYIHMAPVMANLSKDPETYRWTSYKAYVGKSEKDLLGTAGDVSEVLGGFSADLDESHRLYSELARAYTKEKILSLKKKVQSSRIIGSKKFTEDVRKKLREDAAKENEEVEKSWVASRGHKVFIAAGVSAIIMLVTVTSYMYKTKLNVESTLKTKEVEFSRGLEEERKKVKKDLEERHRADMVSYRAMSERLEIEKKKTRELSKERGK